MSWVNLKCFSDLTSSQATEGLASLCKSGLGRLHTVKSTDTHKGSFSATLAEDLYPTPPSGMTYELLKEITLAQLTSFMEATPARMSALQDMEKAWQESEAVFFSNCVEWSKKSHPDSSFWKTCRVSSITDFLKSSHNLQKWGMTVDGRVSLPQKLKPRTEGRGGSYWPTPNTLDSMAIRPWQAMKKQFSTTRKGRKKPANLREAVHKECYPPIKPYDHKKLGVLNPQFAEWLMGVNIGWTELEPWVMEWFRLKQKKRLKD